MSRPSPLFRYSLVPLAVAAAMLLRWPLWSVLQGELAFLFLWPAVIFCAWYGGMGPGLFATLAAATAAAFFLLEPRLSVAVTRPADLVGLAVFVLVNAAVSVLCGRLHESRQSTERQREWLRVSLASIGDAVISVDTEGRVAFMNPTAEALTGWASADARGQSLERVFSIIHEATRQPVENPVARVIRAGAVVGLANHTILVARDGTERPIEDSAAPIKADDGGTIGVILVFHDVSEKRQREAELQEAQRVAHVGSWYWDAATDATTGTDELFRIYGLDPTTRAFPGFRDQDGTLYRHDSWEQINRAVRETMRTGVGYALDVEAFRAGAPIWITTRSEAVRDAGGAVVGLRGTVQDITERKRAEAARLDALRLKQVITDNAATGIIMQDGSGRCTFMNPAAEAMTGYPFAELRGSNVHDAIHHTHPDGRPFPMSECEIGKAVMRMRPIRAHEDVFVRKDGTFFRVMCNASPVQQGGVLTEVVLEFRDITEEKRAAEALRESEERFRTLADTIPQLAWTARPDGHIDWYNRRWYEYTGTTPEQMEGWGWQSVHDAEELPRVLKSWQASIATGEPFDMVFPLKGADGRFRPFLTRVLPLRGADGRILQWFGTNTDVSEIKEMEEALRDADRRKDQFVMMLAHELRNPLAPICTSLQLLQAVEADRQVVEQARAMMARQVGHMTRIIDDLLDVSRLVRGRVELRPERLDLGRFARTVLDDQRPAFDQADLSLEVVLPELPVWANADPTRLTQVIDNLLQNAAKFTDRGGTVTVRVQPDAGRAQAVLTVRDTGMGIEPDLLPHLFETFTQGDRSLERSKGGLGLGLSMVKGLVELHGGTVEARSQGPGRGAEFVVRLPLQPEPAAVTGIPAAPERAPKRLRVLVIEDNQDAADSLKLLLDLFGHEVTVAYTGPTGVAAAVAWGPDAVVCDIGLPGLDGYGVARALRGNPMTAKARLIAVTGYGGDEDRRLSRDAGFDTHLTKPADPTALQELLAQTGSTV